MDFEKEVLESEVPVVVDFYAEWCPPCLVVAEMLEELEGEYRGRVKFVKVDVDEHEELAEKYEVMSVPTIAIFHRGELVDGMIGVVKKEQLRKRLDALLNGGG